MATIPAFEAKTKFGELLDRVIAGEEIIITRHEKPVARLIAEGEQSRAQVQRAVAGLRALQTEIAASPEGKRPFSWRDFKSFVAEGRR
jgi:prevent-host-death family protein